MCGSSRSGVRNDRCSACYEGTKLHCLAADDAVGGQSDNKQRQRVASGHVFDAARRLVRQRCTSECRARRTRVTRPESALRRGHGLGSPRRRAGQRNVCGAREWLLRAWPRRRLYRAEHTRVTVAVARVDRSASGATCGALDASDSDGSVRIAIGRSAFAPPLQPPPALRLALLVSRASPPAEST